MQDRLKKISREETVTLFDLAVQQSMLLLPAQREQLLALTAAGENENNYKDNALFTATYHQICRGFAVNATQDDINHALIACAGLAVLQLRGQMMKHCAADLSKLVRTKYVSHFQYQQRIDENHLNPKLVELILRILQCSKVSAIDFTRASLNLESALVICRYSFLQSLCISHGKVGDVAAVALAAHPTLQTLSFDSVKLTDAGGVAIAKAIAMRDNSRLEEVSLIDDGLENNTAFAFSELKNLKKLTLGSANLGFFGVRATQTKASYDIKVCKVSRRCSNELAECIAQSVIFNPFVKAYGVEQINNHFWELQYMISDEDSDKLNRWLTICDDSTDHEEEFPLTSYFDSFREPPPTHNSRERKTYQTTIARAVIAYILIDRLDDGFKGYISTGINVAIGGNTKCIKLVCRNIDSELVKLLSCIIPCVDVTKLEFENCLILAESAAQIAALKCVAEIHFNKSGVYSAVLMAAAANPYCEEFRYKIDKIDGDSIQILAMSKSIKKLYLENVSLAAEHLAILANNNTLQELDISHNNLAADGVPTLATMRLVRLVAKECDLKDEHIMPLVNSASLRHLNIRQNPKLTLNSIENLMLNEGIKVLKHDLDVSAFNELSPMVRFKTARNLGVNTQVPSLLRLSAFAVKNHANPKVRYKAEKIQDIKDLLAKPRL